MSRLTYRRKQTSRVIPLSRLVVRRGKGKLCRSRWKALKQGNLKKGILPQQSSIIATAKPLHSLGISSLSAGIAS